MILKIGHRGARGYEPENTLLSFKKALELNVDMVELDVHVCKTGELIVIHDDKVERTTSGKGCVVEKTLNELRRLDAGKGEKVPTLWEVLDLVDRKVGVNIELKGEGTAKPVFGVIEKYVKEYGWSYNDFLISSFDHCELRKFNKLNPRVKIGALIAGVPVGLAKLVEKVNAYSIHLSIESLDQELVDDIHKQGMKIFVYTVNDPDDIKRVKSLGVDGIFSDYPDRL